MGQIWQVALAIIASIGGAGVIILGVVKFTSNIIAERLSKKYEIKMNKELEAFKAGIDKKTYISRARFDAEFQIYRELSENVLTMIEATNWLFPHGLDVLPEDEKNKKKYILSGTSVPEKLLALRRNQFEKMHHLFLIISIRNLKR